MPRNKEFDEAQVLDRALELFRERGFRHTSFQNLTTELKVSRQSLYDTYGDKQALYQAALKRYLDHSVDLIRRKLDSDEPVREAFLSFFTHMIKAQCSGQNSGCLMVNSMIEISHEDAGARALAQEHARLLEGLFATRLSRAQRAGEIAKSKDPVALGRFLYHTVLGLAVGVRSFGDREGLMQNAQLALQILD